MYLGNSASSGRRSRSLALILIILGPPSLAGHLSLGPYTAWILGGRLLAALVAVTADMAWDGFVVDQLAGYRRGRRHGLS